jgi:ABC-type antimicrobial peptide transport system permease subunit
LAEAVGRALAGVDATLPVSQFHTQTGLINRLLRTEWMLSFLAGAFGIIAVLLAAIGLAGLLAYAISRRTREIGVRMALGASAQNTVRMVLADSLKLAAVGVLLGLPCAFAVGALLKSFLYNLQPLDPATATLALAGVVAIALAAACGPAVRAANINPNNALREE